MAQQPRKPHEDELALRVAVGKRRTITTAATAGTKSGATCRMKYLDVVMVRIEVGIVEVWGASTLPAYCRRCWKE